MFKIFVKGIVLSLVLMKLQIKKLFNTLIIMILLLLFAIPDILLNLNQILFKIFKIFAVLIK